MALAFVGGAALGAAFGELLKEVLRRKNKVAGFKPTFERLEFTIKSITPIFKQIEDLKKELDHPKEELDQLTEQLQKGVEIVGKCSKVSWWNPYTRADYTMKLHKLDNSITRFLTTIMQAQQSRDTLQILLEVKNVGAKLERINVREPKGELNNPIGLVGFCGVPDPPDFMVGLDVPLKELKMRLLKDGEPPMLVLSAPGGCGKTTLVEKLCQDEEIKGKFKDNIFFVTVSNTPSLKVIIQKLFQHKCNQAPEFQNDEDAVNRLEQLLKRIGPDPVLLVLDDVWSGSESLLEKFVFQIPDYKILVTSRSEFPRFDSTYKLKLLNDEDSMSLFRHSAFPQNEISYMPDKDLLNEIVRNCKGFPLALIVVGRSLRGQPGEVWRSRVMEWSGGQSIFHSQSDILNLLKTSLDVLDKEVIVKECFMDLGSFPEDQRIPAAALIDMWVELYKLDEDGVYAKLHELSTRNLVNLVTTRYGRNGAFIVDGTNGRTIGKLFVSNKEISKGSNGTIVFEGTYSGRSVAVKRLVQGHHDIASEEIQNLIKSDKHQNIVRLYGEEKDEYFVYLALEKCTCSLADLIQIYSDYPSQNTQFFDEYNKVRLDSVKVIMGDINLWKANRRPSPLLLKLMRDVVSGLVHLHKLKIIHRDLKPQNVLIIKEESLRAKLCDMGFSKRLHPDMSSLGHQSTGCGTSGWRAPEQLCNGRQTRAMDLFSLGCVLFFCITGGSHPFGDHRARDINIEKNQVDLSTVEYIPEAENLFSKLLVSHPESRPKALQVLHHPLFWKSKKRLSFVCDTSDRVELESKETNSNLLKALENIKPFDAKWDTKMEPAFIAYIGLRRRYKVDSVRDLLRVMRNQWNHHMELPNDIKEILGTDAEGFDDYFASRFPKLLIEVYKVVGQYCKEEKWCEKYLKCNV